MTRTGGQIKCRLVFQLFIRSIKGFNIAQRAGKSSENCLYNSLQLITSSLDHIDIQTIKILPVYSRSQLRQLSDSAVNTLFYQGVYATTAATARRTAKTKQVWTSKTTTLHVHHVVFYVSLPSLHDSNVKLRTNFTFCRGRKQKTTFFFFS